jgi:retron-type reverse transcriptase
VIQGDLSGCFDKIPPKIIMKCIESNTTCDKTLQLIRKSLTPGYIDPNSGEHLQTTLGTPQVSVFSPLLANILLNELDKKVLDIKNSFEKCKKRARNKEYDALTSRIQSLKNYQPGSPVITELAIKRRSIPSLTPCEPDLRRLMYIRYAYDFVILITGTIDDAKHIKHLIADILTKKCGLELHDDKTLITATKEGFKFLGA